MRFFYSIYNDLKQRKCFTILVMIELLLIMLVGGIYLQMFKSDEVFLQKYNAEYENAVCVSSDVLSDYIGRDGLEEGTMGASFGLSYGDTYATVINPKLAEIIEVEHKGKWFSGDTSSEYREAIVSDELKNVYKKNEIYDLEVRGVNSKIKIIGYLGADSMSIDDFDDVVAYNLLFAYGDMLVCDDIDIVAEEINSVIATTENASFYIDNYKLNSKVLGDLYDNYYNSSYNSRYFSYYIMGVLVMLISVTIVSMLVCASEKDIRKNSIKYIVGNNKSVVLSESVKAGIVFAVPFTLNLFIVSIINILNGDSMYPSILPFGTFFTTASIALIVYAVSTTIGIIRVLISKPLIILKKQ